MRLYICPIIVLFVFFCIFIPAVYNYNAITYDVFSPNPLSDAYNPNEALLIMKVVAASYAVNSSTCLEVINKKHGTDFEEVYHKVSHCAGPLNDRCTVLVVKSPKDQHIIVAFRGTDSINQLIDELSGTLHPQQPFLYGRVHHYFYIAFKHVWFSIEVILRDEITKDWPVIFSGMSLGGALAAMSAARTVEWGLRESKKVSVRTFGEPRVGDADFAAHYNYLVPNTFRIVNKADLIPHIPPCSPLFPHGCQNISLHYYHHSTEVWYPKGCHIEGDYTVCAGSPEDPNCSNSLDSIYTFFDHVGGYFLNAGAFAASDCNSDF